MRRVVVRELKVCLIRKLTDYQKLCSERCPECYFYCHEESNCKLEGIGEIDLFPCCGGNKYYIWVEENKHV